MATEPQAAGGPVDKQAARRAALALYLIVFSSGAILMGVEIAGSRILAPSFGTTIYVWGSLIGLFMGAMAAGYYIGGMLSDVRPSFPALATIVSLAGVYVFVLIPHFGPWMCTGVARSITSPSLSPLVASTLLFFVPSFLMAMVSPYAIKLHATSLAGVGGVAGKLYALSTFGSIVGTLGTAFILIPYMEVSTTMQLLGVLLVLVAVVCLVMFRSALGGLKGEDRHGAAMLALIALAGIEGMALFPVQPHVEAGERLLHYEESVYHDIGITEEVVNEGRFQGENGTLLGPDSAQRWLKFNENLESGIYPFLDRYENAVTYTDVLHLPVIWNAKPKRLLVVGGGGGVVPIQYRAKYPSIERIDVLEIDGRVEYVAKEFFRLKLEEGSKQKIHFHIGDARMRLIDLEKGSYDVIVLDAYSSGGQIPFHLMTWEFLHEVREYLAPGGVLASNLIAAVANAPEISDRPADLLFAEHKTMLAAQADFKKNGGTERLFNQVYVFPKVGFNRSIRNNEADYRNVILIATREERRLSYDEIVKRSEDLTKGEDPAVKIGGFVWHAKNYFDDKLIQDNPDYQKSMILRDNFAPVETMYRPVRKDEVTRRDQ